MLKRILYSTSGICLLVSMLYGRQAYSYVATSAGWVGGSVKNSIPVEFEIDRARRMVKDLVPDIRKNMQVIAQEEVEVERLREQIGKLESTLSRERADLLRIKSDLASNPTTLQYASRTYSNEQVKLDLANRFEHYKTQEATLASLREIEQSRGRSLAAAREKLSAMWVAKRNLTVDVENLEARLKMVEVAQTTSDYQFDDSQLGRCKELMTDLRTRLNVAERIVNSTNDVSGQIPLDKPSTNSVVEQVTEYFADDAAQLARLQ